MPYLSIQTNAEPEVTAQQDLLALASRTVAEVLGKPESYVMIALQTATPMCFAGNQTPAAYLQLKSLGLPETRTGQLSDALCSLVAEQLGIPPERIYIEFSSPDRRMWGWNNTTF